MILFHGCWSGLGHFELWECSCPANNHQLTMALIFQNIDTKRFCFVVALLIGPIFVVDLIKFSRNRSKFKVFFICFFSQTL